MKRLLLSVFALAFISAPAYAAPIIDQNQPLNESYMTAFYQGDLAQSFQQTNANISGAGIELQPGIGSVDTVTIQLWNNLPTMGGSMLASASALGTSGSWVDVFWSPVAVVPSSTLYLVFTGNTSLGVRGSIYNPYPYGFVYANWGYGAFPSYDYTFRTYYDNAQQVPTPEPSTMLLLGSGLAGLAFYRSRRSGNK